MKKAFTLLELLIVVVIIGILALISAPIMLSMTDKARNSAVLGNVNAAASSVTSRFAANSQEQSSESATITVNTLNNGGNKNPIDQTQAAFVDAQTGTKGQVSLDGTVPHQVTINGYDKDGNSLVTKIVEAPE